MGKKIICENNATDKERQKLFSQAGIRAINATRSASLPLTYVEGTSIIREVNGEKIIIGKVNPEIYVLQKKIKIL